MGANRYDPTYPRFGQGRLAPILSEREAVSHQLQPPYATRRVDPRREPGRVFKPKIRLMLRPASRPGTELSGPLLAAVKLPLVGAFPPKTRAADQSCGPFLDGAHCRRLAHRTVQREIGTGELGTVGNRTALSALLLPIERKLGLLDPAVHHKKTVGLYPLPPRVHRPDGLFITAKKSHQ
jgi:hypothetical protein